MVLNTRFVQLFIFTLLKRTALTELPCRVQLKAYPLYNQLHFLALPATIVTAYLDQALTGQIKDDVLTWGEWKNPKQSKNAYNATPHPHTGVPRVQHTMLTGFYMDMLR